jgi:hypothetical protein
MSEHVLEAKTQKLESAFFREGSEDQRRALAREEARARDALADATGITDAQLVARLAELGIRVETLAALTLIPLIEVAWADGVMEEKERRAVLKGAVSSGIPEDSASHGLLELWTAEKPPPDLVEVWREFIAALCASLTPDEATRLCDNVIGRAREVADAAGGFLGLVARISARERTVLDDLGTAFGGRSHSQG